MMKNFSLLAALLCGLSVQAAQAKVALVIGNDAYSSDTFKSLDKAVNDAHTIADKLRGLGYQVIEKRDLTLPQMESALHEFNDRLKSNNEVGVFYYAGHGMQVKDNNYLIPVGANIERDYEAETRALLADEVLNAMLDAKTKINIVILDACRDNSLAKRGGKRGLADMSKKNTFILFSTQKDEVADDGVFVDHLKNWLDKPNLSIDEMVRKVRDEVRDVTKTEQIPAYANNLSGDFYFNYQPAILKPQVVAISPDVLAKKEAEAMKAAQIAEAKRLQAEKDSNEKEKEAINAIATNEAAQIRLQAEKDAEATELKPAMQVKKHNGVYYIKKNKNPSHEIQQVAVISRFTPSKSQMGSVQAVNAIVGSEWQTIDRYQVKDGLVKDTVTGLMWMRCSLGQEWNGKTCQGEEKEYTWDNAMKKSRKVSSYLGYRDWRLPSIQELKTLVHCTSEKPEKWNARVSFDSDDACQGSYHPTIFSEAFPNASSWYFWSSTQHEKNNSGMVIYFDDGSTGNNYGGSTGYVRLVRTN